MQVCAARRWHRSVSSSSVEERLVEKGCEEGSRQVRLYLPEAIVDAEFKALLRSDFITVMCICRVAGPRYNHLVAFVVIKRENEAAEEGLMYISR